MSNPPDDIRPLVADVQVRVKRLQLIVSLLLLFTVLMLPAVYGSLVNYFGGDALLYGGSSAGAVVVAFFFGWFARGGWDRMFGKPRSENTSPKR